MASRSRSRGREPVFSSGRGGAGNIRPISKDPGSRERGPDDYSHSRGREIPVGTEGVSRPVSLIPFIVLLNHVPSRPYLTLLSILTLAEVALETSAPLRVMPTETEKRPKRSTNTLGLTMIPMHLYVYFA